MIHHISDDLYQISETISGTYGNEVVSVYVLTNDSQPILIDCGSHLHRNTIMADLDTVLNGRTPSHIFLTHSELPHAGNITAIVQRWPSIRCLVSNVMLPYIEVIPVLPLAQITQVAAGTKITVGERTLEFVDALLKDQPGSQWIYDGRTQALFCGDGFGYHFQSLENQVNREISSEIQANQFESYHRTTFRFLRWIKPALFNADLDKLFQKRPIAIIAPTHGLAIQNNVEQHLSHLKAAITTICQSYRMEPA